MYKVWEAVYLCKSALSPIFAFGHEPRLMSWSKYFLPGSLAIDFFPILLKLPSWLQPWVWFVEDLQRSEKELHEPLLDLARQHRRMFPLDRAGLVAHLLDVLF